MVCEKAMALTQLAMQHQRQPGLSSVQSELLSNRSVVDEPNFSHRDSLLRVNRRIGYVSRKVDVIGCR